jgi:zinc transporter
MQTSDERPDNDLPTPDLSQTSRDALLDSRLQELDAALHAHALIYAAHIEPGVPGFELSWHELNTTLDRAAGLTWIHLNTGTAQARSWILACESMPVPARQFLLEDDERQRVEQTDRSIVGVISDLHYRFDFDPDQIATLRFYLDERCLISTRTEPLAATDELRNAIRQGVSFTSTVTMMIRLFDFQADTLAKISERLSKDLSEIEDDVLKGSIGDKRGELGRIRRLAVRLHRHFAPQLRALRRLCGRPPDWIAERDAGGLRETADDFAQVVDDLLWIQERAKLLQEELASRVAEETNRNLYVLSLVTAVMLPVTLVTGIFGMNVGGLPGLNDPEAFWQVIVGMVIIAGLALVVINWRRLF